VIVNLTNYAQKHYSKFVACTQKITKKIVEKLQEEYFFELPDELQSKLYTTKANVEVLIKLAIAFRPFSFVFAFRRYRCNTALFYIKTRRFSTYFTGSLPILSTSELPASQNTIGRDYTVSPLSA